jgi:hypothetical protein
MGVCFLSMTGSKAVENGAHLDLASSAADREQEMSRLVTLGAKRGLSKGLGFRHGRDGQPGSGGRAGLATSASMCWQRRSSGAAFVSRGCLLSCL